MSQVKAAAAASAVPAKTPRTQCHLPPVPHSYHKPLKDLCHLRRHGRRCQEGRDHAAAAKIIVTAVIAADFCGHNNSSRAWRDQGGATGSSHCALRQP